MPAVGDAASAHARGGDSGASAVEFALVLPFLLMLVFGMLTGGITLNQKLGVEQANREAARWAATLPLEGSVKWTDDNGVEQECPPSGDPQVPGDCWFASVARYAVFSAHGALAGDLEDRLLCVAYVDGDHSKALTWEGPVGEIPEDGSGATVDDGADADCGLDGKPSLSLAHVEVRTQRPGWLNIIFFSTRPMLGSDSVAIYEPPALSDA